MAVVSYTGTAFFIRGQKMTRLSDDIVTIKGIGEKTAALFYKMNIYTVEDLLLNLPKGFTCFEEPVCPSKEDNGNVISIPGIPVSGSIVSKKNGRYHISLAKIKCGDTIVSVRFFNMPYIRNVLKPGQAYILRGVINCTKDSFSMLQPQIFEVEKYNELIGKLLPNYRLTKGITNHTIQKACKNALSSLVTIDDYLSKEQRNELELLPIHEALCSIHMPDTKETFMQAKKRLAFHEFFTFLYLIRKYKSENTPDIIGNPLLPVADTVRLLESLPYTLTNAQKKAWQEIEADMDAALPMNRLLQGDVGSGKTVIAFLALLKTAANNRQGALMAPTEVLAEQHYRSLIELISKYHLCIRPVLLLGSMRVKEKREALEGIANGTYNVIIGTHAIMQEKVVYQNLALVITDEQHRFGVNQREALRKKGTNPHILVMSATPIPRTLALILYGDLSVSLIDELPANRLPIKNCVVNDSYRPTAYSFMQKEIAKGRQVYIICPMVEESEATEELENVIDYTSTLQSVFPKEILISYIHGKMSLAEKNTVMQAFERHEIDILVSTTVIEVGINVPNATVMMIENSDRYGLAQLHQLRGRVGRGLEQSYCIFMSSNLNGKNEERLKILNESNDGFYIANKDLELRGPGQLGGIVQSGELGFVIADIYNDHDMLLKADSFCDTILSGKDSIDERNFSQLNLRVESMADKMQTL